MIKCPFCSTSHTNNAVFCDECGQYLVEDDVRSTEPTEFLVDPQPVQWVNPRDTLKLSGNSAATGSLVSQQRKSAIPIISLQIGVGKRSVKFRLNRSLYIGRMDPLHDIFPDIDLTDDDGQAKGVSRRHVRMFDRGDMVLVEDLGSFNGTLLNGERLPPFLPAAISENDQLRLGTLEIEVVSIEPR